MLVFENDNLICLLFVFFVLNVTSCPTKMQDIDTDRWSDRIFAILQNTNVQKCGKTIGSLKPRSEKCNPTVCLLGILLILYVKNVNLLSIWLCNFYF